ARQQGAREADRVSGVRRHRPRAVEAEELSRDDGAQPRVVRSVSVPDGGEANNGATAMTSRALVRSGILVGALAAAALGRPSAQSQRGPSVVAIRGGTIVTVTKGTIQN